MTADWRVRVAVAAIFLLGVGLRVGNLGNVTSRSPDERVCTRQARAILEEGGRGLLRLIDEYGRDPSSGLYPPPTRAGYLWLVAGVMRVSDTTDERAGALLSCGASIGSLALLLLFGFRFLPPPATLAAGLLFAVSPMELALSRRSWQDALVGFLGLSFVYLAAEIERNPGRRGWLAPYVVLGSAGILVKELAPIAYALVTLRLLWTLLVRRRDLRTGVTLVVAGLAGAAVAIAWLSEAVGGFTTLLGILVARPGSNAANEYALLYQTGPAWQVLQAFWIAAPTASLLCLAGLALLLLDHFRIGLSPASPGPALPEAGQVAGTFVVCCVSLPMVFPHWLNLRYLSSAFGPIYLVAGIATWWLLDRAVRVLGAAPRVVAAVGSALLLVVAAADVHFFREVFVRRGVPDLSIRMLREAETISAEKALALPDMAAMDPSAVRAASPEALLDLSLAYSRAGRHLESIAACREALRKRPEYAEAYNNIAAAHASLQKWDEAIEAAREAVRLRPDYALARNNLAWAEAQKRQLGEERRR